MLTRIVRAAITGGIVFLACLFVGMLLVATGLPVVVAIGAFLNQWAVAIAILAALAAFVGNFNLWRSP